MRLSSPALAGLVLSLALGACIDPAGPTARPAPAFGPAAGPRSALVAGTGTPGAFTTALVAGKCMDVENARTEPYAPLIIWSCTGGSNQQFTWLPNGEIRVYGTMCLDAFSGAGNDRDPIILYACTGGANQHWVATAAGEIRGMNGKCLDVEGANPADRTRLIIWTCHGGSNQRWDNAPDGPRPAFVVTTTADAVDATPGDGICLAAPIVDDPTPAPCTLRAAIQEANVLPGPNRVTLPAGTYTLRLPAPTDGGITGGDLNVTGTLELTGAGRASTVVTQATPGVPTRVLHLSGGPIVIAGVTIRGGNALNGEGAVFGGSGIFVDPGAVAELRGVQVSDNFGRNGTGIYNAGTLTLDDALVANNTGDVGAGIYSVTGATLTVRGSTVTGNRGSASGAGILNDGALAISNSTVSDNSVVNSSFGFAGVQNFASGTVQLNNVTITNNRARLGGGIRATVAGITLANTIVAGNLRIAPLQPDVPSNCNGTLTSAGYNLVGAVEAASCTIAGTTIGNLIGVDPLLGPLADNGGPTLTHALLAGSPALDAGNPASPGSSPTACLATDQRGLPRTGSRCDIGAVEGPPVAPSRMIVAAPR